MSGVRHVAPLLLALFALAGSPSRGASQDVDTTLTRIERLIVAGDRTGARLLVDSLFATLPPDSPRFVDALYWRAASASSAADAEREYLRIIIEHSLSTRAPDALLALAQLEFARGDRTAARRRFDRLLRDYPSGRHVARASLWSGRLAIEERDPSGCATLQAARPKVAPDDIELRNQFDYFIGQCAMLPPIDTTATPADTTRPPVAPGGPEFSVQVAAYSTRADATALFNRLKARGFDVRVVGDRAPFRVRVGRYRRGQKLPRRKPACVRHRYVALWWRPSADESRGYAVDAAVPADQGAARQRDPDVQDGRLLRDVLR
jgi:hypothetical protein